MSANHKIHRAFLIAEGSESNYPSYHDAKLKLVLNDPAQENLSPQFLSSPLFPVSETGVDSLPSLECCYITFMIVPNVYPGFSNILNEFKNSNKFWFSLGLANLIIIDSEPTLSLQVVEYLKKEKNLHAYEIVHTKKSKVVFEDCQISQVVSPSSAFYKSPLTISSSLPVNVQFGVSEFIISINIFLAASKKFTPQYFINHLRTVTNASFLVTDLSFLYGDNSFDPTVSLLSSIGARNKEEALDKLSNQETKITKQELINDCYFKIIQFNSALSYIYSQAYSGIFPLFDHNAIIRRHSLLGIGGAIGALFELLCQLEQALFRLPFESIRSTAYAYQKLSLSSYFSFFIHPSQLDSNLWMKDSTAKAATSNVGSPALPEDYFNRLSFYSGRLGFRENDLTATAAIQVISEAQSLQWNIITYTHEIIHNHVRMILNEIIKIPASNRNESYDAWLDKQINLISSISEDVYNRRDLQEITYTEYFTIVILRFHINSRIHGSLSKECSFKMIGKLKAAINEPQNILPGLDELKNILNERHKDVTEIFVHVIDYKYIYNQDEKNYITSIWSSWINIPSVTLDLKQYILRSLLVISLSIDGNSKRRFERSVIKFRNYIHEALKQQPGILSKINFFISDESNLKDLKFRFYNCVTISDLVHCFFTGKMEEILDNADKNLSIEESKKTYSLTRCSFDAFEIKSKVRFIYEQIIESIKDEKKSYDPGYTEKVSAWLLLTLSSVNYGDQI